MTRISSPQTTLEADEALFCRLSLQSGIGWGREVGQDGVDMAYASDHRLLVLHAVRLKGFADAAAVTASTALDAALVDRELQALQDSGLALYRDGRLTGFALTTAGRAEHATLLAKELADAGVKGTVAKGYAKFLGVNAKLLEACTVWQMRDVDGAQVPNDHTDADHDAKAIALLRDVNAVAQPVCAALAGALDRFTHYGPRLASAAAKVTAGELDWFTKPLIDSFHTVWFELHEDLLATLGIERGNEATST